MKNKVAKEESLFKRCVKAPFRVLGRTRDFYVRSETDCSGRISRASVMGGPVDPLTSRLGALVLVHCGRTMMKILKNLYALPPKEGNSSSCLRNQTCYRGVLLLVLEELTRRSPATTRGEKAVRFQTKMVPSFGSCNTTSTRRI
ncbi:hypothetical protein IFM89_024770 [Coptis chinensis]|uniref:Uncharacterized protein n=1 Tax=Coptis chinensis TaxID=261450 RepID=A0A835HPV6_9MAGN|nr:hypothetical protein IFM89_024770 [Coptis chinensis]